LAEHNPSTVVETLLVRAIAREAAQIESDTDLLDALHFETDRVLGAISQPLANSAPALSGQPTFLRRLSHDTMRRTLDLTRSVLALEELKRRRAEESTDLNHPDPRFASETQCLSYLARRFRRGLASCRRCGSRGSGSWLAARRVWECSRCRTQTCCRHGSVMAKSSLPLTQWFHAVRCVLLRPSLKATELAGYVKLNREATAGRMIGRIRTAILSGDSARQLAGLDEAYLADT
jgi:hypothetical protein